MIGKKAQGGDYLAFMIFAIFLILLSVLVIFIIPLNAGSKTAYDIKVEMGDVSNNLFLYGFLRQNIDNKNMADVIALSYINNEYNNLKEEIIDILEKIQKDVNFKIYINEDKVIEECRTKCKGEPEKFTTILPLPNKEAIDFKLILYETK